MPHLVCDTHGRRVQVVQTCADDEIKVQTLHRYNGSDCDTRTVTIGQSKISTASTFFAPYEDE